MGGYQGYTLRARISSRSFATAATRVWGGKFNRFARMLSGWVRVLISYNPSAFSQVLAVGLMLIGVC